MKPRYTLPLLLLLLTGALFSCNNNTKVDNEKAAPVNIADSSRQTLSEAVPVRTDTIKIEGPFVYFFFPSDDRIEQLNHREKKENFKAERDAFMQQATLVIDSLKNQKNMLTSLSSELYISVKMDNGKMMAMDRTRLKSEFGIYMTDGIQFPVFKLGNMNASEMKAAINKYFTQTVVR
ncbi:MAG TPA: hypothetical protein VFW78_11325 [Bacteroidia bacterium]|nr:hypothetical protein [Bacteroidia bacterium]